MSSWTYLKYYNCGLNLHPLFSLQAQGNHNDHSVPKPNESQFMAENGSAER